MLSIFELLKENATQTWCKLIRMPESATALLTDMTRQIQIDSKLFDLYQSFYTHYIESGAWTGIREEPEIHPYVEVLFGRHASLFYVHAALERLPYTRQIYARRGISEEIFVDTLRDIGVQIQKAQDQVGYPCIRNFYWIWRHLEGRLFRIGRLQYMAAPFRGGAKAFYNSRDKRILLLCDSGLELRANGDMQGVCESMHTPDGFVTEYTETDEAYRGNPITPLGKGSRESVVLPKTQWRQVLDKGDTVLEVHIPKDGSFDLETIQASFEMAKEFYRRHFPELDVRGLFCHTWMFSPQLGEMLGDASNIVKFQRLFHLYPTCGSVKFLWKFVFGDLTELKDAKPDTFLRKQVLEYLNNGKEIFDMRGVSIDSFL